MDWNPNERPNGKRWLDRAEEMLTIARTVREETRAQVECWAEARAQRAEARAQMAETRAQMERLAADWLLIAAREDERQRPAHDDRRSADKRHGTDRGV
jgi:hypothetical protein